MKDRPTCVNEGCEKPVANQGKKWRAVCWKCHLASYGKTQYAEGVVPVKKDYCENVLGKLRVGFKCEITKSVVEKRGTGILELDHIDGNPYNNVPKNIMTLCKNCHSVKSRVNGDYRKNR